MTVEVRRGDVWALGDHRLMCGDSTDPDDVATLMGGGRAELLFTSPPYSDMREYNGAKELDPSHMAKFISIYAPYCEYMAVNLGIKRKDREIVPYWDEYIYAAHAAGLKLMAWNVWDKGECGSVAAQSAFIPIRHEFIFVFGRNDKQLNRTWKKQIRSIVEKGKEKTSIRQSDGVIKRSYKGDTSRMLKEMESVVQCRQVKGLQVATNHPAPFPLRLPSEYIAAITDKGQGVCEPFSVSGTTIIAAEKFGRACYAMELDPTYCEESIWRWEVKTGKRAELLERL